MSDPYLKSLLGDNEKIRLECRQHWFVFARDILVEVLVILSIIALVTAVLIFWATPNKIDWVWFGYLIIIPPIISLIYDFFQWWNRKYVITDFRVIQISGIINKDVIDSSLEKVNDVKLTQSFFGRIFNFGTVEILTASELGVNKIRTMGNPIRFKTTMINAKEELEMDGDFRRRGQPTAVPSQTTRDIPTLIAQLDNLRQQGVLTAEEFQAKKTELLTRL